jgi:hypothetical protein
MDWYYRFSAWLIHVVLYRSILLVLIHRRLYIYIRISTGTGRYTVPYTYTYRYCIGVRVCIPIRVCICTHTWVCTGIRIGIGICLRMRILISLHICICIYYFFWGLTDGSMVIGLTMNFFSLSILSIKNVKYFTNGSILSEVSMTDSIGIDPSIHRRSFMSSYVFGLQTSTSEPQTLPTEL